MDERHSIILVDDNTTALNLGRSMLKPFYKVYPATSAAQLFELLEIMIPDLILLDIVMPEMDGYQAIKKMKADSRFADIPVIFLTGKNDERSELEGLNLGAVEYITKPFSVPLLLRRIANQFLIIQQKKKLQDYADNLLEMVRNKTKEVFMLQHAVLSTVADLVDSRDKRTGGRTARIQRYLKALTDELLREGIYAEATKDWDQDFFLSSALLHDVGKIAITDIILNKPAKLDREEFEAMKTHVTAGMEAIEKIVSNVGQQDCLRHAMLIAGTHHEKWDGTGYPTGLAGTDIPLEGRLMAIADVYDALVSVRPYKKALSHQEACKIIEDESGRHFDPVLVDVFRNVADEFAKAAEEIGKGEKNTEAESLHNNTDEILNRLIRSVQSQYSECARQLADNKDFVWTVAVGNAEEIRRETLDIMKNLKAELLTVTDAQGQVLARGHSDKWGDSVMNQSTVQQALRGKVSAGIIAGTETSFSIRASAPLMHQGELIGTLSVGTCLWKEEAAGSPN